MAAGTTTEIMMQFVPEGGRAVPAECTTIITADDKLANLTVPGFANGFEKGRYFLVDSFKFGAELHDSESPRPKPIDPAALQKAGGKMSRKEAEAMAAHLNSASSSGGFERWRSAKDDSWKQQENGQPTYSARIDEFSFTRRIDTASTTLFSYAVKQKSFAYASLIKRKSAPAPKSIVPLNQSYVRIDFADVLITGLSWSDDDVVEEDCTFRATKVRIQYWSAGMDPATRTEGVLAFLNKADWIRQVTKASNQ